MGGYFNVFITFPNVSMTYPNTIYSLWDYRAINKVLMAVNGEKFCQMRK